MFVHINLLFFWSFISVVKKKSICCYRDSSAYCCVNGSVHRFLVYVYLASCITVGAVDAFVVIHRGPYLSSWSLREFPNSRGLGRRSSAALRWIPFCVASLIICCIRWMILYCKCSFAPAVFQLTESVWVWSWWQTALLTSQKECCLFSGLCCRDFFWN